MEHGFRMEFVLMGFGAVILGKILAGLITKFTGFSA